MPFIHTRHQTSVQNSSRRPTGILHRFTPVGKIRAQSLIIRLQTGTVTAPTTVGTTVRRTLNVGGNAEVDVRAQFSGTAHLLGIILGPNGDYCLDTSFEFDHDHNRCHNGHRDHHGYRHQHRRHRNPDLASDGDQHRNRWTDSASRWTDGQRDRRPNGYDRCKRIALRYRGPRPIPTTTRPTAGPS